MRIDMRNQCMPHGYRSVLTINLEIPPNANLTFSMYLSSHPPKVHLVVKMVC